MLRSTPILDAHYVQVGRKRHSAAALTSGDFDCSPKVCTDATPHGARCCLHLNSILAINGGATIFLQTLSRSIAVALPPGVHQKSSAGRAAHRPRAWGHSSSGCRNVVGYDVLVHMAPVPSHGPLQDHGEGDILRDQQRSRYQRINLIKLDVQFVLERREFRYAACNSARGSCRSKLRNLARGDSRETSQIQAKRHRDLPKSGVFIYQPHPVHSYSEGDESKRKPDDERNPPRQAQANEGGDP